MVLTQAVCAVNLATAVLANGMCCCYEMKKEEDRKKEQDAIIRQSISSEWERQRFLEMIERQEERDSLKRQEERRFYLMSTKKSIDPATKSTKKNFFRKPNQGNSSQTQAQSPSIGWANRLLEPSGAFRRTRSRPRSVFQKHKDAVYEDRAHRPNLEVFTDPTESHDFQLRNLSSLMDDCEGDEPDEEFEEVCIE